jgi:hypothetical protein
MEFAMSTVSSSATPAAAPWWKFGHVWLVLAGPLVVIVAGFITLWLAMSRPDLWSRRITTSEVSTSTRPWSTQRELGARDERAQSRRDPAEAQPGDEVLWFTEFPTTNTTRKQHDVDTAPDVDCLASLWWRV